MYVAAQASGSQTAVITTEHTLNSPAVAGSFRLLVDTSVMVAGDVLELRAKQVALTGGTLRVVGFAAFYGAQPADDVMKFLELVDNELVEAGAVSFTLKQTFGTGRVFPWKVVNVRAAPANSAALSIDSNGRVDVIKVAGTTQTARDLGASVIAASVSTGGISAASFAAGAIDNAAIATDAIGSAELAASAVTEIQAGLSTLDAAGVRAAVGLASANLDTQLTAIDDFLDTEVAAILADTNELQTDWADGGRLDLILDARASQASVNTVDDFLDTEVAAILAAVDTEVAAIKAKTDNLPAAPAAVGDIPTASAIADQVWDEVIAGHAGVGSTGAALAAAGGSGDPWSTALPGAYSAGTAGKIIGDNINATVSSRASQTSLDTVDDFLDTEIAAIKAKTDLIPASPAAVGSAMTLASGSITAAVIATDAIDADAIAASAVTELQAGVSTLDAAGVRTAVGLASANLDTQLTTIDDFLDTEVAAIKAKTDALPSDPADASDIAASFSTVNATLATIAGYVDTEVAAILAAVDTEVAAIKAKTDNLPASPANEATLTTIAGYLDTEVAAILVAVDTEVAAIKAKTDALPASPANEATLTTIAGYLDTEVASILAAVDTEVAAIKLQTDLIPASPAAVGSAMTLTSGERNSVGDALLDRADAIETGLTFRQAARLWAAALAGKASGLATATAVYRNAVADSKARITATVDVDGNRTAITTDVT